MVILPGGHAAPIIRCSVLGTFHRPEVLALLVLLLLLPGCIISDTTDPDATPTPTLPLPGTLAASTTSPDITPTPTYSAALDAMLSPGNTVVLPERMYFRADTDIWTLAADGRERAQRIATDLRIGPWSQTPDGAQAAVVTYLDIDGRGAEEIRLIRGDELVEQPLYGPIRISGDGSQPGITSIDWSWDGTKLALSFANGTLGIIPVPGDPATFPVQLGAIERPADTVGIANVAWSPNGAGVAYTSTSPDGRDLLYITPTGDAARAVTESRPVRVFDWMPGRGRIAFVEESGGPDDRLPGSIFTVTPDGGSLELLLSAGRFAPAATITAINASPNGQEIAVTVAVPDTDGQPRFQSLWQLSIDSGNLQEVPIAAGFQVVETWWTSAGLIWRGVDVSTSTGQITGDEPFVLGRYNAETDSSAIIFQQER